MTDAEGEIKKATDTLLRLLKESGDKTQAIANYYASVAYWESKGGSSASDLPDAAIEVIKAEEAQAFVEHRKNHAANKAAEEKKEKEFYETKFWVALLLLLVIFWPAFSSHQDKLTKLREARAQTFIKRHVDRITGNFSANFSAENELVNSYSEAFKKEFPKFLDANERLRGRQVKFDSLQTDTGFPFTAAKVIKIKLPLEGQLLEYTIEDTSLGKHEPVIIATNEPDIQLDERTEEAQQSAKPQLSFAEYQRKMTENTARKAVENFIRAAATGDSATYNSTMVLGKCNANPAAYIELWQSPILNADTKLNENMNECVVWLTFNRSSLPNRAKLMLEYQAGRWWIADIQVPDSENRQQGYNSQQQYQAPQEDPDASRKAEEYDRNTKKQWQQQNAKDDFMQTPSLGGDQDDPVFEK